MTGQTILGEGAVASSTAIAEACRFTPWLPRTHHSRRREILHSAGQPAATVGTGAALKSERVLPIVSASWPERPETAVMTPHEPTIHPWAASPVSPSWAQPQTLITQAPVWAHHTPERRYPSHFPRLNALLTKSHDHRVSCSIASSHSSTRLNHLPRKPPSPPAR
jgi:hypothetical protein